jgi:hypothetical protein
MAAWRGFRWLCGYILHGHIIVDLGHWVVVTAGHIAETAMLFATLWVTATNVAPKLTNPLPIAPTLSSISLMVFSLLPEIILFSAIITSYQYWYAAIRQKNPQGWMWAVLFTLPTLIFFVMTVVTISSFAGTGGDVQQATGGALVVRCLAGWFYALISLIRAKMPSSGVATMTQAVPAPVVDYAALALALQPYLAEMKSSLVVDLKPVVPALDYLALAKMVAPHLEAMMVDLSPVVPQVAPSPVDLALKQVDLSPVEPALSPVALASTQVDLSPEPPVKARSNGSQVALASGSELEKSSIASVMAAKSSNEERDRKLAAAYAAMVEEGKTISGRTLAATAKCARPAASEWLRLLFQVAPGGSESSSGSGSSGLEASGSDISGSGSDTSSSADVDLKPRSRVRNTDELMALDLEVSNAG